MSIRLEKALPGFGFVRKSTGLTERAEFDELLGILLSCAKARPQVVRCWIDGQLTSWDVIHAAREERLKDVVPDARTLAPFADALEAAWEKSAAGPATLVRYRTSARKLLHLQPQLRIVADLERVDWRQLERSWPGSDADYMACYRMLSTFLTLHFGGKRTGKAHPWRARILDQLERRVERPRAQSATLDQFKAAVAALPNDLERDIIWSLVITGLRQGEFFALTRAHLNPHTFELTVPGTKTAASAAVLPVSPRLWPYLDRAVPARRTYNVVREHWRAACRATGIDLRIHDLRHLMAQWAVNAGVAEGALQGYLRHTEASTTRRYTLQATRRDVADAMAEVLAA
jgi:integrase